MTATRTFGNRTQFDKLPIRAILRRFHVDMVTLLVPLNLLQYHRVRTRLKPHLALTRLQIKIISAPKPTQKEQRKQSASFNQAEKAIER